MTALQLKLRLLTKLPLLPRCCLRYSSCGACFAPEPPFVTARPNNSHKSVPTISTGHRYSLH